MKEQRVLHNERHRTSATVHLPNGNKLLPEQAANAVSKLCPRTASCACRTEPDMMWISDHVIKAAKPEPTKADRDDAMACVKQIEKVLGIKPKSVAKK